MPEARQIESTPEEKHLDRILLGSMALSVSAAAIEVIVGFTVAHWVTITASKTCGFIVCAIAFAFCATAALLASNVRTQLLAADDTQPENGRRLFMANLDLLTAGLVTLLVIAGVLILITLRPNS